MGNEGRGGQTQRRELFSVQTRERLSSVRVYESCAKADLIISNDIIQLSNYTNSHQKRVSKVSSVGRLIQMPLPSLTPKAFCRLIH